MSSITELVERRELLWNLTLREMRGRYKRTALGWAWSLLNPLSTMLTYTIVFSVILGGQPPIGNPSHLNTFALYLMCGLLPWNFFAISCGNGLQAVLGNAGLVRKVAFPREHLVIATVLAGLLTNFIELTVLGIVLVFFGNVVVVWIPMMLIAATLIGVFATGLGLMLSALNVYFRDTGYLWAIVTQIWFFLTPIVYPDSLLKQKVPHWLYIILSRQPMAVAVQVMRNLMYDLRAPTIAQWGYLVVWAAISLTAGLVVFRRLEPRFAEEL